MPTTLFIAGPGAAGKYSVGKAIATKLGKDWALAHNHQAIEVAYEMYPGAPVDAELDWALVSAIRDSITEYLVCKRKSIIHTNVIRFEDITDKMYFRRLTDGYREEGYRVCVLVLDTPLETRLKWNRNPDRIAAKPSKRNTKRSEEILYKEVEDGVGICPTIAQISEMFGCDEKDIHIVNTTGKTVGQGAKEAIRALNLE